MAVRKAGGAESWEHVVLHISSLTLRCLKLALSETLGLIEWSPVRSFPIEQKPANWAWRVCPRQGGVLSAHRSHLCPVSTTFAPHESVPLISFALAWREKQGRERCGVTADTRRCAERERPLHVEDRERSTRGQVLGTSGCVCPRSHPWARHTRGCLGIREVQVCMGRGQN